MMGGSAMAQNSKQRTICALPFAFLWGNDVDGTAAWLGGPQNGSKRRNGGIMSSIKFCVIFTIVT